MMTSMAPPSLRPPGVINALHLTGRKPEDVKMVVNGAGASAIACTELIKAFGVKHVIMCDTSGVIYKGREKGMNQWKSAHAADTPARTLEEAVVGADLLLGLSQKGAVSPAMVASMAKNPIIFAMANPDPEVTPEEVHAVRNDAIMATGRSDYPEPGQQRPVLPVPVPRCARRAGDRHQRRNEDGGGQCHCGAGAQAGAR